MRKHLFWRFKEDILAYLQSLLTAPKYNDLDNASNAKEMELGECLL